MPSLPIIFLGFALAVPPVQAPQGSAAADEAAVAAMKVSSACAEAAERAWHLGGYDKPSKKTPGETTLLAHSSHYNRELKRCLIKITNTTITKKENPPISVLEEVYDAIEQIAIGSLFTSGGVAAFLNKGDAGIEKSIAMTPANMKWFRDLMTN